MLAQVNSENMMESSFVDILEGIGAEKTFGKPRFCSAVHLYAPNVSTPGAAISIDAPVVIWENDRVRNLQTIHYYHLLRKDQSANIYDGLIVFSDGNISYLCKVENVTRKNCTNCVIFSQEVRAR
jgi:hypothetical protein